MDESEWRLHVLGPFTLEHAGQNIRIPRRKVASLLAYLILHPQKHGREELAALFWGDFPDSDALHSLRTGLTSLRSNVDNDVIIVDGETVRFNPTFPLWVDALAYQSYATRYLAEAPYDLSIAFVELYKGDLLSDFYDDWIAPEREQMRRLHLDVLVHITQQMRSRSEYERAITFARRALAVEPANERAHQHLMFCYIALGDRHAALRQYGECRRALANDLAAEPLPETTALYRWIKGHVDHAPAREALLTNLPIPLTSFVGRQKEMADIKRRLAECRLLTVTGPGGSGKTRLAIQVATDLVDAYKDGVWFTDFSALRDEAQVAAAVARTLHVETMDNAPVVSALASCLRNRRALLVLDNCEHVIAACAQLAQDLLCAAPHLKILATSRESLGVPGEVVYQTPALATPPVAPVLVDLAGYEATRLFIERATTAYPELSLSDPESAAVIAICRRLDGMPLSIELAAARVRVLSVGQIASHLHERFALLASSGRSRPAHQSSLRATIDWSYDLLPGDEQALLRRLSIFVGSFTLAGATSVDGQSSDAPAILERLARLVDKSLVVAVPAGEERRYRLLETIRLYAWGKLLDAGERDEVVRRYVTFVSGLLAEAGQRFVGAEPHIALVGVKPEYDNIVAAVDCCVQSGDVAAGLGMFTCPPLLVNARILAGLERQLTALLAAADASVSPTLRGTALLCANIFAVTRGDFAQGARLAEEGLALCQLGGNKGPIALATLRLARTRQWLARWDEAICLFERSSSLFRELGYHTMLSHAILWLSETYLARGDGDMALATAQDGACRRLEDRQCVGPAGSAEGLGSRCLCRDRLCAGNRSLARVTGLVRCPRDMG